MASVKDTAVFFSEGNAKQYEYVLTLYPEALKLKAQEKNKKPEELMKLDTWYQEELPKKIKSRGKDAHLTHDELVQTMKWKLMKGKYYPHMTNLIKINTPRAVLTETKKALKKLPNLDAAITALSNLKGVGTTMASAVLAAAAPDLAPYMADECLLSIPDFEGIDYTTKEYLKFVQHIRAAAERLNAQEQPSDDTTSPSGTPYWTPHRVEMALWAHFILRKLQPDLLNNMPGLNAENGDSTKSHNGANNGDSVGSNLPAATPAQGEADVPESAESSRAAYSDDSNDFRSTAAVMPEDSDATYDSVLGAASEDCSREPADDVNTNDSWVANGTPALSTDGEAPHTSNPVAAAVTTLAPIESADDNAEEGNPPLKKVRLEEPTEPSVDA